MSLGRAIIERRAFVHPGERAGLAVHQPRTRLGLKLHLHGAIGKTIDLDFAGVAQSGERFAGQNLYQERGDGNLRQSSWVPEEDLRFFAPIITSSARINGVPAVGSMSVHQSPSASVLL